MTGNRHLPVGVLCEAGLRVRASTFGNRIPLTRSRPSRPSGHGPRRPPQILDRANGGFQLVNRE